MKPGSHDKIFKAVRERYADAATQRRGGCCSIASASCCEGKAPAPSQSTSEGGFARSEDERAAVPSGSDMGLSCGNPTAIASIRAGETVLDLGSGGGVDCFLAAGKATESGHVIGVDMTPEMVSKARSLALEYDYRNVEFRLGEIENLPAADESVDVVISNCVINLSPDKRRVFAEIFRVLRPGGRIVIADMVATAVLPEAIREDLNLHVSCISGAVPVDELRRMLRETGFEDIAVELQEEGRDLACSCSGEADLAGVVAPAMVTAFKPGSVAVETGCAGDGTSREY